MGTVHSFCCSDRPSSEAIHDDDRAEEQSRIWTEGSNSHNNLRYGACTPPTPPSIFKIVLPKLMPIEIDGLALNLNNSSNSSSVPSENHCSLSFQGSKPQHQGQSLVSSTNSSNKSNQEQPTGEAIANDSSSSNNTNTTTTTTTTTAPDTCSAKQHAVIKEEYCREKFESLRALILKNGDDEQRFRQLLWSCIPWVAPGGKSGSTFLKTINDQFILKEMSKLELQSFLSIADDYFKYIGDSYHDNKPSLLSTILGIYRIVYTNSATQSSSEYYFMVMRNLFYKRQISQRFDLKGSVRNRLVETDDPDNNEHVLMDENLLRITCEHPLLIHARSKRILNEAIDNDSKFLTSISVMDYSLLVGVDREEQELVLGIIDYVRPFTWDKKIERVVKSVVSAELPTIVEPDLYRERFCEAMDKYFESVPDNW